MKNQFNARRFALLFRKHTSENYKAYLMALGVLVGAMLLVMGFVAYSEGKLDPKLQDLFFTLFLVAAGTVFTSMVFSSLGDPKKAIAFLTLPASSLEKYLVAWVYSFLIYVLVFVTAFYLVVSLVISVGSSAQEEAEFLKLFGPNRNLDKIILMYAFLHAVSLVGAIFFKKAHFIKTVFTLLLAYFTLVILNKLLLQAMLGIDINTAIPMASVTLIENDQIYTLGVPDTDLSYTWLVAIGFILIIWAAAYYKLKEKQL